MLTTSLQGIVILKSGKFRQIFILPSVLVWILSAFFEMSKVLWTKKLMKTLPNPCGRVLFEKLTGHQLVKKFPTLSETSRVNTLFMTVTFVPVLNHITPLQVLPTYFVRLILILFYNPHMGLPCGLFTSGFSSKSLHAFLFLLMHATCNSHLIHLNLTTLACYEGVNHDYHYAIFSSPLLVPSSLAQISS